MRFYVTVLFTFFILFVGVSACNNGPTDPPPPPNQVELDILINPNGSGTVSPNGGEFDEDETVTLTATAESGWRFSNWDGDRSSTSNPFEFTISEDMTIIANFAEGSASDAFESEMTVSNGSVSRPIDFGLLDQNDVQDGIDGNDFESPPIAPSGSFFTGFIHDGMNLYQDYRPLSEEATWELRLNRNTNSNMNLSWSFSDDIENGELKLVSDPNVSNPSLEIDMLTQSSYTVSDPSIKSLFIVYTVSQAKSIITEVDDSGTSNVGENNPKNLEDKKSVKGNNKAEQGIGLENRK